MTEARTALVTGASRGIGFGIALRLAEEGFRTAIIGRNRRRIEEAAKEYSKRHQDYLLVKHPGRQVTHPNTDSKAFFI